MPCRATSVLDEHVVGQDGLQPMRDADLREVDYGILCGLELSVEVASKVERGACDPDAVVQRCRESRPKAQGRVAHAAGRLVDGQISREQRPRHIASRHGEERCVVAERGCARRVADGADSFAQAVEPTFRHDASRVQQHNVPGGDGGGGCVPAVCERQTARGPAPVNVVGELVLIRELAEPSAGGRVGGRVGEYDDRHIGGRVFQQRAHAAGEVASLADRTDDDRHPAVPHGHGPVIGELVQRHGWSICRGLRWGMLVGHMRRRHTSSPQQYFVISAVAFVAPTLIVLVAQASA